jgi:hypothetical protein
VTFFLVPLRLRDGLRALRREEKSHRPLPIRRLSCLAAVRCPLPLRGREQDGHMDRIGRTASDSIGHPRVSAGFRSDSCIGHTDFRLGECPVRESDALWKIIRHSDRRRSSRFRSAPALCDLMPLGFPARVFCLCRDFSWRQATFPPAWLWSHCQ